MSSDKTKFHALQRRLNSIDEILDPDGKLPLYLRRIFDLNSGAGQPVARNFRIVDGKYIIEWSERGKQLGKAVFENEDDCAYSIVISKVQEISSYLSKGQGVMTDERLKKRFLRELELINKVDVKWSSKYRKQAEKSLMDTLQRREQNRLAGGKTTPLR